MVVIAYNRMTNSVRVLWTSLLLASASVLYVDCDSQETEACTDLTAALLASVDPDLEVQFPTPKGQTLYALSSLGMHPLLTFHCNHTRLQVTATLFVVGTVTEFQDCHIESAVNAGALVAVFGSLTLTRGSVKNNAAKGFALYGLMHVSGTVFQGNSDSIFVAQSFGFGLDVQGTVFQGNTSPAGVILLLGIGSIGYSSTTNVRFDGCTVIGNGAYMGGSFMYLSVNPTIEFPPIQVAEQRSIEIRNCTFNTNPGYLVIAFTKYMNVTFSGNDYTNHNYGFLVDLYDSSFTISTSTVSTISRFFISRYIGGLLDMKEMKIYKVVEGPGIVLMNRASITAGFVSIEDMEVRSVTLLDSAPLSAVLAAVNVAISVKNLRVSEGYTYACACGCFSFCMVSIDSPQMANMTAEQGAMLAFLGSVAEVNNAYLWNVTLTRVSLTGAFISTVTFRNTTFIPGPSSYAFDRMKLNMHIAFDSTVYIYNAYYDLHPIRTAPVYYLWASTFECSNITYPRLYSRMADINSVSTMILRNLTVLEGSTDGMLLIAMKGYARIEHLTIQSFKVQLALFTVLSDSVVEISDITFENVKFAALAIASNSKLALGDLTFRNIEADTLFWYVTSCQMNVTNLRVFDSKFDLMQFTGGFASFKSVVLHNVTVRRRFITLRATTVRFDGLVIDDLSAVSVTPFCSVQKSSISFRNSELRRFRSREQGLVELYNSSLEFINSEISDFNVTFVSALRSNISILSSTIREGGLRLMDVDAKAKVSAGFLEAEDSVVLLEHSHFEDVTGMNGGVLAIQSRRTLSSIKVESCNFEKCGALRDGGTIRAISAYVSIKDSLFAFNSADRGGCIYFECTTESQCSSSISSSVFHNNTAREGGVVKWTFVRPSLYSNHEANNSATYGPFEASIATHMSLLSSNESVMSGVPGVIVVEPILIAFLDVINQTVATDSKSAAQLESDNIIGTTYLLGKDGIANFSSVIVQTVPGTSCIVEVFSPTINAAFPYSSGTRFSFTYNTRKCTAGEVTTPTGCFLCPKNTYSVRPTDPECKECPKYATCPGSFSLILDKGYWRSSALSDVVSLCPVSEACEGGANSKCSKGYTDKMCMKCEKGYYSLSQVNCTKCEALWLRTLRTFILLGVISIFSVLIVRQSLVHESTMEATSHFVLKKILLNFLHFLLILPLIGVNWKSEFLHFISATEMLFSYSLTSLVVECISAQRDVWKPVYVRALLASTLPCLLLAVTGVVFLVCNLLKREKSSIRHYFQSCLILLYIAHPYITKAAVSLLSCVKIESESYWLVGDVSVKCWESPHLLFLYVLCIPMVALFVVGIPALISSTVIRARRNILQDNVCFFTIGLSPNHPLWECAVIVTKSLILCAVSLLSIAESITQIILTLMALYCLMEWHIRKRPFASSQHNKLEGFSRFFQFLLTGTGFYYRTELNIYPVVLSILATCSLVLVCGFVAVLVFLAIRAEKKGKQVIDAQSPEASHSLNQLPSQGNLLGQVVPNATLADAPSSRTEDKIEVG